MNGRAPAPSNILRRHGCGVALAALGLSGCADLRRAMAPAPVNPESPIAAQAQRVSVGNYAVPRLTDVPPVPRNVPTAAAMKTDVVTMVQTRNGVTRFAASHPPLSGDTANFAASERNQVEMNPADIPPADSAHRSDTAADQLRAYAAPPPAISSGPAPTPADAQPKAAAPPGRPAKPARPRPAPTSP